MTNPAAVIAHCCISPNRYGGLLEFGVFLKSFHAFVIRREVCVRSVVRQGERRYHFSKRCCPTGQSCGPTGQGCCPTGRSVVVLMVRAEVSPDHLTSVDINRRRAEHINDWQGTLELVNSQSHLQHVESQQEDPVWRSSPMVRCTGALYW